MTREKPFAKGENQVFSSPVEVRCAYDSGEVELHAHVKVRMDGQLVDTTVGRMLLADVLPTELPFLSHQPGDEQEGPGSAD